MLSQADPKTEAMIEKDKQAQEQGGRRGKVSVLTCPDCGGVMWQEDSAAMARFQCHTGHAYIGEQLMLELDEGLEAALWSAVRIFREQGVLARQMATKARSRGNAATAQRYEEQAQQADQYATLILEKVLHSPPSTTTIAGEPPKSPPGPKKAAG